MQETMISSTTGTVATKATATFVKRPKGRSNRFEIAWASTRAGSTPAARTALVKTKFTGYAGPVARYGAARWVKHKGQGEDKGAPLWAPRLQAPIRDEARGRCTAVSPRRSSKASPSRSCTAKRSWSSPRPRSAQHEEAVRESAGRRVHRACHRQFQPADRSSSSSARSSDSFSDLP